MYNKYMDTLFDRDMSVNHSNVDVMQDDLAVQSMSQLNMQQPMPSGYLNQPVQGNYMQQPFQRSMVEYPGMYDKQVMQGSTMNDRNPSKVNHKVGDIYEYYVKQGDNLYGIARVYGSHVDLISCMNKIHDENVIKPGQRILIPVLFEEKNAIPRQNYGLYF